MSTKKLIIGTTVGAISLFCAVMIEPKREPNVVEKDPILKELEEGKTSMEIYKELIEKQLKEGEDTV